MLVGLWVAAPALGGELTVWHTWRDDEAKGLHAAAEAYGEAHATEVRLVEVPFGAYDSKLETAIPRGNGPDLFVAGHGSIGKWSAMGLLDPTGVAVEGQLEPAIQAVTLDRAPLGWPLAVKSVVLLYDPTVVTTPPATTDELVAMAKALAPEGGYGLAWQAAEPYFHAGFAHAFGAWAIDPDGVVRLDTEAHARAYAFSKRLAVDEGIAPPQPSAELIARLYADGLVPFVLSGPWFVAGQTRPIAAAPLPVVSETGEPMRPLLTVDAAFVADQAKHPDEARAFATWLSGPEGAAIRARIGRQAVSHAAVTSDDPLVRTLHAQARTAVPLPTDPDVASVWEAEARALRSVMRGATSPEVAAAGAQTWFTILSRPPPPPVSPVPYLVVLGLAVVAGLAWLLAPLRDPHARRELVAHGWDYLWVAPAGLAMLVLVIAPFVTGAAVSLFAHWRGDWTFVGLQHFVAILTSRDFPITKPLSFGFTLAVTVLWTATNVALHVAIGVALAMVLREPWIRLRGVFRAALILPWAIPNYITALIWRGMFHAQYGAINAVLGAVLGHEVRLDWFGSFATAFAANVATNTWLGFPFMMVVTLGSLQAIPRELEEAAEVDGAGAWFRFRHVIWPLLRPALLPSVILGSVWTFNLFNVVYLVSGGEPNGATEILVSDAYRWAFSRGNRYGYAAAYAVLIFGVLLVYARAANRLVGRKVL